MMSLTEQVIALIFSFIYGGVLSVLYNFNYNLLFYKNIVVKIIFNILFVLDLVLLYFLVMRRINNAIIHPYFYIFIILGFFSAFDITKRFRKILKMPPLKKKPKKGDQKCKK
ncbi:MAG TPA: hypothetical protein IAB59_02610 [Candidatus Onthousia faecipullorum]|uniref:Spore cortex biosynthesis protein YabQ n=1 Tax=Candidatus Onthousia faecipullorum TaxID=2840887 RepID=A0A9D1GB92_9FIRM|nr:hypothetical protein [Candidatus Onthousia faecipullorum]